MNGPTGPRRFRRRPHRLACNIPGSGRGEARRPPQTRLPRLAPSTAPSRATRRTAGDKARRVGRSPVPARHMGSRPSVSIQAAHELAAGKDPPASLIASTPGRELTGNGAPARDTTCRLSSPTRLRGHPERAESRETRKRPENGQAHRRGVAMALARGGDCFPTSQEGCGGLSPHLTLPSLRGPPRSRLNRAPLPL